MSTEVTCDCMTDPAPAGERPDLIAEVFEDAPPSESATRVTLGAPIAPAGERLEPVEPGALREGDEAELTCVYRGRVQIDGQGFPYLSHSGHNRALYGSEADSATWQRVVADPPLPTTPGAVIRCIHAWSDEEQVAKLVRDTDGSLVWSVTGLGYRIPSSKITKCLRVYDEGGSDGET